MMHHEDVSRASFSMLLTSKRDHYPCSDRYLIEVYGSADNDERTEREHMAGWFRANDSKGFGSYTRQVPNTSARRCYNHLQNAASLLWIAEAVGIDEETVRQAYDAAVASGDRRRACGAIRKIISWDMISALI